MIVHKWIDMLKREDDLNSCIRLIVWLCQMSGLMPFKFERESNRWKAHVSVPYSIYTLACSSTGVIALVKTLLDREPVPSSDDLFGSFRIADGCRSYLTTIALYTIVPSVFSDARHYVRIFDAFERVDFALSTVNIRIDYSRLKIKFIGAYFSIQLYNMGAIVSHLLLVASRDDGPSLLMTFVLYCPVILLAVVLFQFYILNRVSILYIERINVELQNWAIVGRIDSFERKDQLVKIEKFKEIYDIVCDNSDIISDLFSFRIIIILASSFLTLVFNLYSALILISRIIGNTERENVVSFTVALHQIFMASFTALAPILLCDKFSSMVKKTAASVNRIMLLERDAEISNHMHRFSLYILQRSPKFTASGLTDIDKPLLFTIIGAVATYIIILIQFSIVNVNSLSLRLIDTNNKTGS